MKRAVPPRATNHTHNPSFSIQQKQHRRYEEDDSANEEMKDSFVDTFHKTLLLVHSHQKDEELVFARSLDSGVRSIEFTGFEYVQVAGKKSFTAFKIQIFTATSSWRIFRRYSEFATLAEQLHMAFSPPKTFGFASDRNPAFLAKRQQQLEEWLRQALQTHGRSPEMIRFLVSRANCAADYQPQQQQQQQQQQTPTQQQQQQAPKRQADAAPTPTRHSSNSSDDSPHTPTTGVPTFLKAKATTTPPVAILPPAVRSAVFHIPPPTPPRQMNNNSTPTAVSEADFEKLKLLGAGTFGQVYLVRKRAPNGGGQLFAMKILEKQHVIGKHQVEHTKTERRVLAKVRHPFIARLHYAFQTPSELYFVIDFCAGGELFGLLQQKGKFPEQHCRFYSAEIALAIGYLHSLGIVYRDLKPENVLIQSSGHIQLVDFGLSKEGVTQISEGSYSLCGTPEYLAPEILTRLGHGKAVDWWSLGSLLFEMLTGLPPWYNKDRRILFQNIKTEPLALPEDLSAEAKSILTALLTRDPLARLGSARGLDDIKQHVFFAGLDFAKCLECKLTPPFVPALAHEADTSHFDEMFTNTDVGQKRAGTQQQGGDVTTFSGFSYVPQQAPFSPQLTATSLRALSPPGPSAFRRLADVAAAQVAIGGNSEAGQMRLLAAAAAAAASPQPPSSM